MHQVHLVDLAGLGELPGPVPGGGHGLVLLVPEQLGGGLVELGQCRGQGGLQGLAQPVPPLIYCFSGTGDMLFPAPGSVVFHRYALLSWWVGLKAYVLV